MQDYWKRIGLSGSEDLDTVQARHLQNIPFENLSVLAGQGVRLDPESIWQKLVLDGRGGYCFEQNSLFEQVLLEQGYSLVALAARVRRGVKELRPHTHKLLRVEWRGQEFLVDVGFGGEGPACPIPWQEGAWETQTGVIHRLVRENELWVLQVQTDDRLGWLDLYATDNRPYYPIDYEMMNHFTSTHPSSLFVNSMLVGRHLEDGYQVLFDGQLKTRSGGVTTISQLSSRDQILTTLESHFGLQAPAGLRVPPFDT
jgi:N-hydroxyarylamine O-acetyltransferase